MSHRNEDTRLLTQLAAGIGLALSASLSTTSAFAQADEALEQSQCEALADIANLSVSRATWKPATDRAPAHCYIRGTVASNLSFHIQLPAPSAWNGKFLNWGDGGHDGDLDYANHRVAEGYAVANSNMGHDSGSEPGATWAFNDRQAEMMYGSGHIVATVNAAHTAIRAYYGEPATYSYHEGCSTGGRQGLMAAQRFPGLFDGIVAEAPAQFLQRLNLDHNWDMQQMFRDNFAGALAYDTDGNGTLDSLTKAHMLREAVLARCDANDGIVDGVVNDPLVCDFVPAEHLADQMCADDVNADACFTEAQVEAIQAIYDGPYDSRGNSIYKGKARGTEVRWPIMVIPHEGNNHFPGQMGLATDYVNFLFYEEDPGVPTMRPTDLTLEPDASREPPEFAWWQFDFDDFTAGLGDTMRDITDADDPDLTRYLHGRDGKLLMYFGWADTVIPAEPVIDYYHDVVDATFDGNLDAAREKARLFMAPGMGHCRGGPGPDTWDRLAPLVEWVENGQAPESVVATHQTNGVVDNERILCPYPEQARYIGSGDPNDRANWVAANFECAVP
jgi:feruloyl esterase